VVNKGGRGGGEGGRGRMGRHTVMRIISQCVRMADGRGARDARCRYSEYSESLATYRPVRLVSDAKLEGMVPVKWLPPRVLWCIAINRLFMLYINRLYYYQTVL
jgi:hypothetical protein